MLIEELIHRTHLWKIPVIVGVRTQSLYLIRKHAELLIAILDFPLHGTILSCNMVQVEDAYKRLDTFPAICPIIKTPLFELAACVSRIKFPNREFNGVGLLDCYLQFIRKNSAGQSGVFSDTVFVVVISANCNVLFFFSVAQLGRFTNLKVLKLCNEVFDTVEVTPAFACALQKLKNLEVLHLPFGKGIKKAAEMIITVCQTLPCLRSLRMHSCLNDDSLVTFAKATQNGHFLGLHKLIIDHSINTTERGWQELFHCLGRLSNLVKVDISRPVSHLLKPSSRLVLAGVRAIAHLPRIQHVLPPGWLLDEMDWKLFEDTKKRHPQSRHISLTYKIHVQRKIVETV
ncbi:BIR1E protein, partial [Atractosteus spatula]|nr:BIR1E protein [Atractosteus spatula]